jgi:hypothetical protein
MRFDLPFDWVVLHSIFDSFYWNVVYFGFGNDLWVVLDYMLDGVVIGVGPFHRHLLDSFAVLVLNDLSFVGYVFSPFHWLIFDNGLFVWDILDPAFACVTVDVPWISPIIFVAMAPPTIPPLTTLPPIIVGAITPAVRVTAFEVRVLAAMLLAMPRRMVGCITALLRRPATVGIVPVYIQVNNIEGTPHIFNHVNHQPRSGLSHAQMEQHQ